MKVLQQGAHTLEFLAIRWEKEKKEIRSSYPGQKNQQK